MRNNTLRYSVAGHLPLPVLVSADGARYLPGEGSAVGLVEDGVYPEQEIALPRVSCWRFSPTVFSRYCRRKT
ncbi:MAG: hypothetical protein R3E54_06420 [Halioglobus sp.]